MVFGGAVSGFSGWDQSVRNVWEKYCAKSIADKVGWSKNVIKYGEMLAKISEKNLWNVLFKHYMIDQFKHFVAGSLLLLSCGALGQSGLLAEFSLQAVILASIVLGLITRLKKIDLNKLEQIVLEKTPERANSRNPITLMKEYWSITFPAMNAIKKAYVALIVLNLAGHAIQLGGILATLL